MSLRLEPDHRSANYIIGLTVVLKTKVDQRKTTAVPDLRKMRLVNLGFFAVSASGPT
jgi:hypothetical protein